MKLQHFLYSVFTFSNIILHNKVIEGRTISLSVKEELPQNTSVGRVSYLPGNDTIDNGTVLTYNFLPQGYPHTSLFTIDSNSGQLFTSAVLDREELCGFFPKCTLSLEVAIQSTQQQIFQKVKVIVDVLDINDNAPVFPSKSIVLNIAESVSVNSTFAIAGAVDKDVGKNSLQTYDIIRGEGVFDISIRKNLDGGSVVSLMVIEPLDREVRDFFRVYVMAKDGGIPRKSSLLMLNITILDVNDNAPVFTSNVYKISIKEVTPPGSIVLQVTATDWDSDKFWRPIYRFSALQAGEFRRYFAINSSTGEIKVISPLTQIQAKTIKFVVECVDGGQPPFVAQTKVQIDILDTINSAPTINLNVLSGGRVSELADVGTVVAHVSAIDPDSGRNGLVKCFIDSDVFDVHALDVHDYKISTARSLDREVRAWYNITVLCEDAGRPTLTSRKYFTVQVEDENDNTPRFSQYAYEVKMMENNPVNHVLLQLTATDPDAGSNGNVSYYVPEGTKYGVSVSDTGEIIAERSFDREETSQLRFLVVASDEGSPPNSANVTVIVNIEDVNDFTPTFSQDRFVFALEEDLPAGVNLGTIFPIDKDEGVNRELVLNIELRFYEFENFPFVITPDGDLRTNTLLDREVKSEYVFSVIATDKGDPPLSSSTEVVVNIVDVNDNSPVILVPNKTNSSVFIPDHTEPGTAITSIIAVDNDTDSNGHLQYYLSPESDHDLFHLDQESGIVYLKRHLDASHKGVYPLSVMVKDQGVPFKWANASLEINIVSDNQTLLSQRRQARENTTIAMIMGVITGVVAICVIVTIIFIRRSDRAWNVKTSDGSAKEDTDKGEKDAPDNAVGAVDTEAAKGNTSSRKDRSQVSQGWHFLPGVAVDPTTASARSSQASVRSFDVISGAFEMIRKSSADSYSSGASGNDSGKGGSDDEACHEETSSEIENNLQCADNATDHHSSRPNLDHLPPHVQSSDYVHLEFSANIADVTTLSNYSYYYPGWNEQEMTSEGSETLRRTKRVSFRLEPNSESTSDSSHVQQTAEDWNNEYQKSYYDNKMDVRLQNQTKICHGLKCGEAVIFDLDLQKLNDVIV
ncbi:protocadherin-11 X-linked-like [Gigantopelta aegis]|uniref:protocadherin-11 X-linked-like n=1 Tax=Gigantopelta aegis TaxID=1735272 RepID=UPI001B8889B8|nr:protocadherin-11 X-linked-like [Gigantopelta aegis]